MTHHKGRRHRGRKPRAGTGARSCSCSGGPRCVACSRGPKSRMRWGCRGLRGAGSRVPESSPTKLLCTGPVTASLGHVSVSLPSY